MKKLIFLLLAALWILILANVTGCGQRAAGSNSGESRPTVWVELIDSCEYVMFCKVYPVSAIGGIIHKANCNNPIHKQK